MAPHKRGYNGGFTLADQEALQGTVQHLQWMLKQLQNEIFSKEHKGENAVPSSLASSVRNAFAARQQDGTESLRTENSILRRRLALLKAHLSHGPDNPVSLMEDEMDVLRHSGEEEVAHLQKRVAHETADMVGKARADVDLFLQSVQAEASTWKSALRAALRSVLRSTEELKRLREDHVASTTLLEQGNADGVQRADHCDKKLRMQQHKEDELRGKLQGSEESRKEVQEKLVLARGHHVQAVRRGERELRSRESEVESQLSGARVASMRQIDKEIKMDMAIYDNHGKQQLEGLAEELKQERRHLRFLEDRHDVSVREAESQAESQVAEAPHWDFEESLEKLQILSEEVPLLRQAKAGLQKLVDRRFSEVSHWSQKVTIARSTVEERRQDRTGPLWDEAVEEAVKLKEVDDMSEEVNEQLRQKLAENEEEQQTLTTLLQTLQGSFEDCMEEQRIEISRWRTLVEEDEAGTSELHNFLKQEVNQSNEVLGVQFKQAQIEVDNSRAAQDVKLRRQLYLLESDRDRMRGAALKQEEESAAEEAAHAAEENMLEGRLHSVMSNIHQEEQVLAAAQDVAAELAAETYEQIKQENEARNQRDGLARSGASAQDENLCMLTLGDKLFQEFTEEQQLERQLQETNVELQRLLGDEEESSRAVFRKLSSFEDKAAMELHASEEAGLQKLQLLETVKAYNVELESFREGDAEAKALKLEVAELHGQLDLILGHKALKEQRKAAANVGKFRQRSIGRL
eukprot:gnl/MRDRNA2_/MRDRNA2_90763_c0_seq1.p1 gnl/MRDRNA2_/MRDRNA2_90763_c0~~gnl/MRDRNA2_/MRDRNA2_90763_c0_seq1.p1  ORF type:complete len:766 (+),score=212.34 gnl/MRDRNA2_/MRDRNA2_90763_c0_seq1:63-2300(+)